MLDAWFSSRVVHNVGIFVRGLKYFPSHLDLIGQCRGRDAGKRTSYVFSYRLRIRIVGDLFWKHCDKPCLKDLRFHGPAFPIS